MKPVKEQDDKMAGIKSILHYF